MQVGYNRGTSWGGHCLKIKARPLGTGNREDWLGQQAASPGSELGIIPSEAPPSSQWHCSFW